MLGKAEGEHREPATYKDARAGLKDGLSCAPNIPTAELSLTYQTRAACRPSEVMSPLLSTVNGLYGSTSTFSNP